MEEAARSAALLCSVFLSGSAPLLGGQLSEMCRLQAAVLRRSRAQEALDRDRRRRQYLRRRRAFLLSSIAGILSVIPTTRRPIWARRRMRGETFWATAESYDEDAWKAQFRVSRSTFDYLVKLIGPSIQRRRTNYRTPIEPRRRLAITLWWFARSGEYRSIADTFGVGIATVCIIVRQVTSAIVELLYRRFVSLPAGQQLDETIRGFADRCYPQCAGAVGSTHIPIAPPRNNPDHYVNGRGWHSVILQGVVDHRLRFTDVYAGWPGSNSSASVLASSDLYLKAEDRPDGNLFPREKSVLSGSVEVPVHLIGDVAFPLRPWLMKGYSDEHRLSPEQRRFTFSLASACSVVDAAFMRLKGRWGCLLKKSDIDVSMMPRVVAACCVLHNICELQGDAFLPEWSVQMAPSGTFLIQPDVVPYQEETYGTAEVVRRTIAYNLLSILQHSPPAAPSADCSLI